MSQSSNDIVDDVAAYYSKHAEEQERRYHEDAFDEEFYKQRRRFADTVPGEAVLDAGCGHGRDIKWFESEGLEPVGIDVSEGLVEIAREKVDADVYVMDMRDLSKFDDESFYGVWCCASILFLSPAEMEKALVSFSRVLRPGGVLYVSTKVASQTCEAMKERWGSQVKQYKLSVKDAEDLFTKDPFSVVETWRNRSISENPFMSFLLRKEA